MESTAMLEALAELRAKFSTPISNMEIIRRALQREVSRSGETEMPPILNESQRKSFLTRIDHLEAFLQSEDGADSIELLVSSFREFAEARTPEVDEVAEVE